MIDEDEPQRQPAAGVQPQVAAVAAGLSSGN
jgi:hypothetical protein